MLRALTANLVAHERIETTDAKAKELRRVAERLITRAIRLGDVAYTPQADLDLGGRARRLAVEKQMGRFLQRFAVVPNGDETRKIDLIEKVFLDLARRFKGRPGGYTRIVKLGRRRGDNAPMSIVEFVDKPPPEALAHEAGDKPKPGKAEKPKGEPKAAKAKAKETEPEAEASETAEPTAEKKPKAAKAKAPKAEAEEAEPKAEKKPRAKKTAKTSDEDEG
jgi:large subunit ribosomal protein L17